MRNMKEQSEKVIPLVTLEEVRTQPGQQGLHFEITRLEEFSSRMENYVKPHRHDFYMLLLVTGGRGVHDIDFKSYDLLPNYIYFMYPGQIHSWKNLEQAEGFLLVFTSEFFTLRYNSNNLFEFPFFNYNQHLPYLELGAEQMTQYCYLFTKMMEEYIGFHVDKEKALKSYLNILLVEINRKYVPLHDQVADKHSQMIVQKFEHLINEKFRVIKGVKDYAAKLCITPNYLNAVCTKVTGKSAGEHIRERVMLEAKRLLLHSDNTVSEIASELNFDDNSYFCRFFKKYAQITPEQFRKVHHSRAV
jgi:AraC family transcriptional activator of pobA